MYIHYLHFLGAVGLGLVHVVVLSCFGGSATQEKTRSPLQQHTRVRLEVLSAGESATQEQPKTEHLLWEQHMQSRSIAVSVTSSVLGGFRTCQVSVLFVCERLSMIAFFAAL